MNLLTLTARPVMELPLAYLANRQDSFDGITDYLPRYLRTARPLPPLRGRHLPLLRYIADHPGCTAAQISRDMNITPSMAGNLIRRMAAAGRITRHAWAHGPRSQGRPITITAHGQRQLGRHVW